MSEENDLFLETERLIIKKPTLADCDLIIKTDSDSEVMQFIGGPRTLELARKWFEKSVLHQNKYGFSFGLVFEKETGDFVGRAGIMYLGYDDTQPDIEVGYRLVKSAWGKGYATELTRNLIKWGFQHLSISKLVAIINPDNRKSQRVLEKVGMKYVGKAMYCGNFGKRYEIERG